MDYINRCTAFNNNSDSKRAIRGTVKGIIAEPNVNKLSTRWVPRMLTDVH